MIRIKTTNLRILIVSLTLVLNMVGCAESSFTLSRESRLPKWFDVSDSSRDKFDVTMDYYVKPNGRTAIFKLYDAHDGHILAQVTGKQQGLYPIKLEHNQKKFPGAEYEIITVGEITEIIEHREFNAIFHVTDKPEILEELLNN